MYALRRTGASEHVKILNSSNELVIPSFKSDGIYPYRLSDLLFFLWAIYEQKLELVLLAFTTLAVIVTRLKTKYT